MMFKSRYCPSFGVIDLPIILMCFSFVLMRCKCSSLHQKIISMRQQEPVLIRVSDKLKENVRDILQFDITDFKNNSHESRKF